MKAAPAAAMPRRVEGWDLFRGIGVSAVVVAHAMEGAHSRALAGTGQVFLCIFFVLSGYLITHILMSDVQKHGRVRFGAFYTGRAVRLLPALAVMLVAYFVAEALIDGTADPVWASALIALFYVGNLPELRDQTGLLRHVWTLAFEEQFYFVWPVLLAVLVRRRVVVVAVCGLIAASTVVTIALTAVFSDDLVRLYTLPTTWAAGLLVGCLMQLRKAWFLSVVRPATWAGAPVLGLALAALALGCATYDEDRPFMYLGGMVVVALACAVSLLWFEQWGTVRQWYLRPVVSVGVMTYGLYLWHYPICRYVPEYISEPWIMVPTSVALSILAAYASWHLVELPAQRWYRRRLVAARAKDLPQLAPATQPAS